MERLTAQPAHEAPCAVTGDGAVRAGVERVSALAGVPVRFWSARQEVAAAWRTAPVVLLGADQAASPCPGRRPGVVVVAVPPVDEGVWRTAVEVGAERVAVLPEADHWLAERLVAAVEPPARGVVVGLVAGCGGAGASVLATAVAGAAARSGLRTMLVDADPLGAGLDLALGQEDAPGARWPELASARGRLQPGALAGLLPSVDGIMLLTWGRAGPATARQTPPEAMTSVLAGARAAADVVVVDLPRRTEAGVAHAATAAVQACDVLLVVVPAHVRATAAACVLLDHLRVLAGDVRLVVRLPREARLPLDAVAQALALPVAGVIRHEPGLEAAIDRGEPAGLRRSRPLARGALALLDRLVAERASSRPGVVDAAGSRR